MKQITLCGDDYGQNSAVSQAIITLLEKNRLTATSCLTTFPDWLSHATSLKGLKAHVDIGLHFNLTEGQPLSQAFLSRYGSFPSLLKLMILSHSRLLDKAVLTSELNAQLDQFESGIGQLPHFVDGHQHVHQFPLIREVLMACWENRLSRYGSYIRSTAYSGLIRKDFKRFVLQMSGAKPLKNKLDKLGILHNSSFEGMYHFSDSKNYRIHFIHFLKNIEHQGLIMCHPGLQNNGERDSLSSVRYAEYQYLISDQFIKDCSFYGVERVRFFQKRG